LAKTKMMTFNEIPKLCIELTAGGESTNAAKFENWDVRIAESKKYFESVNVQNIHWLMGVNGSEFGVQSARPYLRDNPEQNWHLGSATVGCNLSFYMTLVVASSLPEWNHFIYLEDDTRFHDGFDARINNALNDVPDDFDVLFLSHCCTAGRDTRHVRGEIYDVRYPLAGHCVVFAKKALPILIAECRDVCTPADVLLFDKVLSKLKTFTLLPRVAEQYKTDLPI